MEARLPAPPPDTPPPETNAGHLLIHIHEDSLAARLIMAHGTASSSSPRCGSQKFQSP